MHGYGPLIWCTSYDRDKVHIQTFQTFGLAVCLLML